MRRALAIEVTAAVALGSVQCQDPRLPAPGSNSATQVLHNTCNGCCENRDLMVVVGCTASLSGPDQRGFELSATTKPAPLRLPDEHAELAFGDFSLTGKLECSGGAHEPMDWGFRVALRRKGPAAIHGALIGALDLGNRRGKRPLSFTSYFFFDGPTTFVSPNEETMSITRLDYRCEIEVL